MDRHLEVSEERGEKFYHNYHDKGRIVMLNLLKFRDQADYTTLESLKPKDKITGRQAYQKYIDCTLPELTKAGSKILFYGKSKNFLIGPKYEKWDAVLLVEHESVDRFINFAQNEEYLKTMGHRIAALEDSRLLPITEVKDVKYE